jgi:hypothetical protein
MAGDKTNPSLVGGRNEYAGFVAPSRPDASTVGPGGNTVDRGELASVRGTKTMLDKNSTQSKPLGQSH